MGVRRRLAVRAEVPLKSSRSRAATAGCGVEQARHKQELRAPQTARLPSRSGATSGGLSYLGRFSGEVSGRYSNPFEQGERLRDLIEMVPKGSPEVSVGPRKQVHRRLCPAEIEELVAGYQAGATACQLADRFRIHRTTVLSLLERRASLGVIVASLSPRSI